MLALVVLARVPAGLVAVPACVAIVLAVESRLKKSAVEKLKSIGLCLCVFVAVTAVTVTVMSGSPAAYIHSWVPENIINGHKMDDVLHGPGHWNFTIGRPPISVAATSFFVICLSPWRLSGV